MPVKRNTLFLLATVVVAFFIFIAALKDPLCKHILSIYLSSKLKSDVKIENAKIYSIRDIGLKKINITNEKGLRCRIEKANIKLNFISLIKGNLYFHFRLLSVTFSYPSSKLINGIAELFVIDPDEFYKFDSVTGDVFIRRNETITKNLEAKGEKIRLLVNGTLNNEGFLNYKFKFWLPDEITSRIPKTLRKVFFTQTKGYSLVQLYIAGSLDKPSINFSTPLFKLRIK